MIKKPSKLTAQGQIYGDYVVTKYLPLKELHSTLVELIHEPTGARIIHIANDDPENLFCLSFQTLPANSDGVAHILEHTVLTGSHKFPVKDPFFAMSRRSLNTYMNAMTGQDFTCYPASSQVEKDFYNLLEVYLDAVFHPLLRHESFLQEGHRLEFLDPKNPKGPLQYQGIVFNEMKGAMNSSESRLWEILMRHLVPDLPYAHNSGGDPKDIPSLTFEGLSHFHRQYYHPSRCLFFFYGNLPLTKHLDFIENELKIAKKIPLLPPLPPQKRFKKPVHVEERYPIGKGESADKQDIISFSWLTTSISNQAEILALCLLDNILTDNDASTLCMALLKQVESSLDIEMSEVPWTIVCKGCDAKDADRLEKVLFKALKNISISQEQIEAALHQLEFQRTEIGAEGGPFGLTLFMRAALIKQHGSEPENGLLIHSLFADLHSRLKDPNYLLNLLNQSLIENTHLVRLTLKADPHLEQEELEDEQKRLSQIRASLTKEDEKRIREQSEKLIKYQEEIENQSLECLPKVTLGDVPLKAKNFPLIEKGNTFHCNYFTNHILYANLVFELPEMKSEELPLLSLLTKLLPEIGCGGRSYAENLSYQESYIGNFDTSLAVHVTQANSEICKPTFSLRGKALYRNGEKLFGLFSDYLTKPDLNDRERIQEWLLEHATELQNQLTTVAITYAIQTSLANQSIPSYVFDQWHGLPYYDSVLRWAKKCDAKFIESLKEMADRILGLKNPDLVLTCDEEQFSHLEKNHFYDLKNPNKSYTSWSGKYLLPKSESQVRIISSPVAFTALGMRTISYHDDEAPYLLISTRLMETLVLHKEIREKGGAYGSGANFTPSTGNFHFFAFRDPNLNQTVKHFQKALDLIAAMKFNERELEEAKLEVLQILDAPVPPGGRAMLAYAWKRAGRTLILREEFRNKVLSATREEVANSVKNCLLGKESTLVSFLGQEMFNKEKKDLKHPLKLYPI
jgi:hypothetical protein